VRVTPAELVRSKPDSDRRFEQAGLLTTVRDFGVS